MTEHLLLAGAMLVTGAVGGVLAGLLGIGGGIVVVPMMEAALTFLGVDQAIRMHVAVATSLATIIPTSVASSRAHYKRDSVDVALVRRWAVFVLVGALVGTFIAAQLRSNALAGIFAVVALLIGIKMILLPEGEAIRGDVPSNIAMPIIPASIGALSSMMGIGGGTFTVMTLTLLNVPIHRAVGTAALFGLAISLPGTIGFMIGGFGDARLPPGSVGYVNLIGFALISPTTVLAAPLGAMIAHGLSRRQLSILLGIFLLLISARMFYRAF